MFVTGAPRVGMTCLFCIVYIKPSTNACNLSIFRSIIHLNIKLCKKNRTKTTSYLKEFPLTQLLGKKDHATGTTLGVILRSWVRFLWWWFRGIRDNDRGRCDKRGRKRVSVGETMVKRWNWRGQRKKLRNAERNNISDIRKDQDLWYWYAPQCWNVFTVQ